MKILAYHSIGDRAAEAGGGLYCVPEDIFRQQMKYLRGKDVLMTFDDGDITNYTKAYPILKEFGMKAYFFIIGEWVGKPEYMGWKEIGELKDAGMMIGSHGMTHRLLTALTDGDLDRELRESKRILEERLKAPVDSISIPRGFCNKKILEMAKAAGYDKVFTSRERIVVRADWDMKRFTGAFNGRISISDGVLNFIKDSAKKFLGDNNYDRIRTRILR